MERTSITESVIKVKVEFKMSYSKTLKKTNAVCRFIDLCSKCLV